MRNISKVSDRFEDIGINVIVFFAGIMLGDMIEDNSIIYIFSIFFVFISICLIIYNRYKRFKWERAAREDLR